MGKAKRAHHLFSAEVRVGNGEAPLPTLRNWPKVQEFLRATASASGASDGAIIKRVGGPSAAAPTVASPPSSRRWPARSRPANLPERNGSPPLSSRSALATRGQG